MPAKRPAADKYAPTQWGSDTEDLTCPSGQVCLVRRIDPMKLLADGTLNKGDMITALVDQEHVAKKSKGGKRAAALAAEKKTRSALMDAIGDPDKMRELEELVNSVTIATVVRPELHAVPDDPADRIAGNVYVDTVGLEDRMFILQYAFAGTRDVAKFRRELDESIGDMANVEPVEKNAE